MYLNNITIPQCKEFQYNNSLPMYRRTKRLMKWSIKSQYNCMNSNHYPNYMDNHYNIAQSKYYCMLNMDLLRKRPTNNIQKNNRGWKRTQFHYTRSLKLLNCMCLAVVSNNSRQNNSHIDTDQKIHKGQGYKIVHLSSYHRDHYTY